MTKHASKDDDKRLVWPAIRRGLLCKCPRCGKGKLFPGFLDQYEYCPACGEPLARDSVGLLLSFLVVMIVASVIILVMLAMEVSGGASPLVYLFVLVPLSVLVPFAILRPAKGAIIALLWARQLSDQQQR